MPNLTKNFYTLTNNSKTNHYIETGAYLGKGIKAVLTNYNHIHSIELSEQWYNYNVEQFKHNNNVKMYLGDSKKILPELLKSIHEPVTIFLDAHYSGGQTALGEEEVPLLFELEILKNRKYDDIIIIDDCRLLGKTGTFGRGPNDPEYPKTSYDWSDITDSKITALMKEGYLVKTNDDKYTDGQSDQYILFKQK